MWYIFSNFINPQNFETEKTPFSFYRVVCLLCAKQLSQAMDLYCVTGHGRCHWKPNQLFSPKDLSVHTKHMTLPSNINVCVCVSAVTQSYPTLYDPMDCSPPGSSVLGISQARILGVICHFLFQGIFAIQGWNPHLLNWQADSLPLSYQRSPIISSIKLVEWMRSRGTRELCEIITL